jgi:hypothetical protein
MPSENNQSMRNSQGLSGKVNANNFLADSKIFFHFARCKGTPCLHISKTVRNFFFVLQKNSYPLSFRRNRLCVLALLGTEVWRSESSTFPAGEQHIRIDTRHLPTGVYVYRLMVNGVSSVGRIVVVQ